MQNLAKNPEYFQTLEKARGLLMDWTEQTGDTIPANPTPDRNPRPGQPKPDGKHTHQEMPGDAVGAGNNNHPGPVTF